MLQQKFANFIDRDKLYNLIENTVITEDELNKILNKARKLKGLSLKDVAHLLCVKDVQHIHKIMEAAKYVKEEIYGKRLVLFAPVYTGNVCVNNCLYCAFRSDNKTLKRKILTMDEIAQETRTLLKEGHKRLLLICGETPRNDINYICEAIRTTYAVKEDKNYVRRINVELAPMSIDDFRKLKKEKIGTYVCFQETYDPVAYSKYHSGNTPKGNYENRLLVMDRAMEAGIDDVGLGVLFGLVDYRFEVLALLEHAMHLETVFGCGPHTVSVPRIEPADGSELSKSAPNPVSDDDFKKIVAIIRIAMPYTGIILSTRENDQIRNELINYGVSQISAGSRTNPGAYNEKGGSGSQFSLGDHRSLDEVISDMIDGGYIPSFCTGCYRKGRVGNDFMDLAKPGLIKQYCMPNALFTFREYLLDFSSPETCEKGFRLIKKLLKDINKQQLKETIINNLDKIDLGERDIYL
ncbi:MAG: [FeFe] hydrogenase H-cluster radical SAM maturase HydG [Bacteroidales bacterium]|jgi:2-iminoacetate synthase|nr:[FeFe] hydrogenase H-cluster radical SAM maturase HydG [Bacteroidales bacterium]